MLTVIKFILDCIIRLCSLFFTINIGDNLNLGLLMCILFIFLPIVLRFIKLVRQDALEELDDRYDESRPREIWRSNEHQSYNPITGRASRVFSTSHIRSRSRRYNLR